MSGRARGYVAAIMLIGLTLGGATLTALPTALGQWPTFAVLTTLATIAQLYRAEAPNHVVFYATPVFLFAGLLLLPPPLFAFLVAVPHLVEWARERWRRSERLRAWYLQPFNVAMFLIGGSGAHATYTLLSDARIIFGGNPLPPVVVVSATALVYLALNHAILGLVLVLARGVSWRESGVLDAETNQTQLILLFVGYVSAVLWQLNPWLILPALSPLLLIYRALTIPQLKQDAQVDAKTGINNARHFGVQFASEFERARRFNRPVAFIMADLDFLREINNTYGHLAGDAVLAGIGAIIRATIRDYDIAGRFGGEEFAVVLPETGLIEAQVIAERIRLAVQDAGFTVATSATPLHVTMSLGVACFPTDAATPDDLTHAADLAVYQAKAEGRNRVVCATDVPRSAPGRIAPPAA